MDIIRLKKPVRVHIVSDNGIEYTSKSNLATWMNNGNTVATPFEQAEVVVFRGGEDINPKRYGEEHSISLWNISERRDKLEFDTYQKCLDNKKIVVGICRGCQLITIANGGTLIQHVGHHYQTHPVIGTLDNKTYETNSIHHQMCFPYYLQKDCYQVLAYSTKDMFKTFYRPLDYLGQDDKSFILKNNKKLKDCNFAEPEMIWYPKTLSLGIQGHPENLSCENEYVKYINKFLLAEIAKQRT